MFHTDSDFVPRSFCRANFFRLRITITTRIAFCERRLASRRSAQGLGAFDPLTLAGTVHRVPQITAPLHVQPEVGAVAEHAREDERGCRR